MTTRGLSWGVAAAAAYLVVATLLVGSGRPVLPLFDGLAPMEPYRWVEAPPGFDAENQEPLPGRTRGPLEPGGAIIVVTDDGQAQASLLTDDVVLQEDQRTAAASMTPTDPASLGPPPRGERFDSNAYEVTMTYAPSGEPLELTGEATVLLRYAAHATTIARWDETSGAWEPLESTVLSGTLQVFAGSDELGTFVALGSEQSGPGAEEEDGFWLRWVLYGAAGLVVVVAVELYLRWRRRPRSRAQRRRTTR